MANTPFLISEPSLATVPVPRVYLSSTPKVVGPTLKPTPPPNIILKSNPLVLLDSSVVFVWPLNEISTLKFIVY